MLRSDSFFSPFLAQIKNYYRYNVGQRSYLSTKSRSAGVRSRFRRKWPPRVRHTWSAKSNRPT